MMNLQPEQVVTLAAIVDLGTFDAAARELNLTPSAVSQRVRALEAAVGRPVLQRSKPVRPTETGQTLLRYARQLELLDTELRHELGAGTSTSRPSLTLVVNGDSLTTWVLPALATVADRVGLELLREDQDHSAALLRDGRAVAAITSESTAVTGCSVRRLGTMRYRPMCSHGFAARWFPAGATVEELAVAPRLDYDRKDDLQDRYLRRRSRRRLDPPRHYVPASRDFSTAIRLGFGWGVVSQQEVEEADLVADLVVLDQRPVDVSLFWQQWKVGSSALSLVADAVWQGSAGLRS